MKSILRTTLVVTVKHAKSFVGHRTLPVEEMPRSFPPPAFNWVQEHTCTVNKDDWSLELDHLATGETNVRRKNQPSFDNFLNASEATSSNGEY